MRHLEEPNLAISLVFMGFLAQSTGAPPQLAAVINLQKVLESKQTATVDAAGGMVRQKLVVFADCQRKRARRR